MMTKANIKATKQKQFDHGSGSNEMLDLTKIALICHETAQYVLMSLCSIHRQK